MANFWLSMVNKLAFGQVKICYLIKAISIPHFSNIMLLQVHRSQKWAAVWALSILNQYWKLILQALECSSSWIGLKLLKYSQIKNVYHIKHKSVHSINPVNPVSNLLVLNYISHPHLIAEFSVV